MILKHMYGSIQEVCMCVSERMESIHLSIHPSIHPSMHHQVKPYSDCVFGEGLSCLLRPI